MPEQRLTQTNLNALTSYANSGDAEGYYSYLENLGFRYATLAANNIVSINKNVGTFSKLTVGLL